MVAEGDAAFNIMGDWAEGYFANAAPNGLALKPHIGFDWTPVPGTQGIFVFLSDSFVLPIGNKNPNGTMAWLALAASKTGQQAFNPLKGSICARTDCNPGYFSEYSQGAMQDWATDIVVGSLTHGVVANNNWKAAIDTALKLYLTDPNRTDQFQVALAAVCKSAGTCQ
jgi:glucose/mannose transport system substrate-binding protein